MSIFSMIRKTITMSGKAESLFHAKAESSDGDSVAMDTFGEGGAETVELDTEVGAGKGWPSLVSVIYYHKLQGLLCVGTESGAVFVYGDGFQTMRCFSDEIVERPVSHIVGLDPSSILVVFNDNTVVVLELAALETASILPPEWIDSSIIITTVHVDEPSEKNYVYLGTSEGALEVLDVTDGEIRIVDFHTPWKTMGISKAMSVSDIKMCPTNDKYLAVSFDGFLSVAGAIVILDLSKQKPHKVFETTAINCLTWTHNGDTLFAGTKTGALLSVGVDKTHPSSPWNVALENDDEDGNEEVKIGIKKLVWFAPQPPSQQGCLFALLTSTGTDNDNLKSVIVGLSPAGGRGDLDLVFSLPPVALEKVINFTLVPTYNKADSQHLGAMTQREDDPSTDDEPDEEALVSITPAVLLLTQGEESNRYLKIVRCPAVSVTNWILEVGGLVEPTLAVEVLPAPKKATCFGGFVSENSALSLSRVLIGSIPAGDGIIPPLPDQLQGVGATSAAKDWKWVLAAGEHQGHTGLRSCDRQQDLVVKGYEDGCVVVWGVSMSTEDAGNGSIWLPLTSLQCGSEAVTASTQSEAAGLMAAGDVGGVLVVWEVCEDGGVGSTEVLRQVHAQATAAAEVQAREEAEAATAAGVGAAGVGVDKAREEELEAEAQMRDEEAAAAGLFGETEHHRMIRMGSNHASEYSMYSTYRFNSCREILRTRLGCGITSLLLLAEFRYIFVGTEEGDVRVCCDFASGLFSQVEGLRKASAGAVGTVGAVLGLTYGNFLLSEGHLVAAVYAAYSDGTVTVIDLASLAVVAYGMGSNEDEEDQTGQLDMAITNGSYDRLMPPTLRAVALAQAEAVHSEHSHSEHSASALAFSSPDKRKKKTFFKFGAAEEEEEEAPPPGPRGKVIPARYEPRFLSLVRGQLIAVYDLHKFTRTHTKTCLPGHSPTHAMHTKVISQKSIVTSRFLTFAGDEDVDEEEEVRSICCAASVTVEGMVVLTSVQKRAPIGHAHLLEGVFSSEEGELARGAILPNGNCYLAPSDSSMVYSACFSIRDSTLRLAPRLPDRTLPEANPPHASLQFKHGRESILRAQRAANRRRRSTVMKIMSPFELSKVFAKTREQRQKEDLFGKEKAPSAENSPKKAAPQPNKAQAALGGLQDTKQALEDRGERIARAALKADDIKDGAKDFKETVARQKAALEKKNARWGLF
ncbi:hypothetical protein B484DRAFT_447799 [Ochromonadaceae sp. CCMP2298]|nr:hypothetical protein B484DRAFT_419516 [Ochromonadaceae sp. CCMP2298]KAJ1432496.1 hypothetical protein B484DRAFT_447799 [Ochromonadaceae sp. CCMP2298]|mmetsp:Transcript_2496/g.5803  ORF Transcript_2496/g.5803 Transcript_2496/m.5803 type:complete len:1199 (+) Transcript_2496:138-3734(+)